jgi:hypothetical protein
MTPLRWQAEPGARPQRGDGAGKPDDDDVEAGVLDQLEGVVVPWLEVEVDVRGTECGARLLEDRLVDSGHDDLSLCHVRPPLSL